MGDGQYDAFVKALRKYTGNRLTGLFLCLKIIV